MEFKTNRLNKIGEGIYSSLDNMETLCQGIQEIEQLQESSLEILDENLKNLKALKKKYDEELASGFFLDAKNYLEEMSFFDNSDEQVTDNFISAFANEVDKKLKADGINTNIDEDTFCEFANQVNSNWQEWIGNYPAAENEIKKLYQMPEISKADEGRKLSQAEELAKSSQSKDK